MYRFVILVFFTTIVIIQCNNENVCPKICVCDKWENVKRTKCINKRLTSIENDIPSITEALDLSNNIISTIPDHGFTQMHLNNLLYINMSKNHIGYLSLRSFEGLNQLSVLDLSYNNLQDIIPDMFITNTRLTTLFLTGNNFITMDAKPVFSSSSLKVLIMKKCFISHVFEENFSKLPSLTTLDLSNNLLQYVKSDSFADLKALTKLNLQKNPIICDNQQLLLKMYCFKNHLECITDCKMSEKIQMEEPKQTTEQEVYVPWDMNDLKLIPKDTTSTVRSPTTTPFSTDDCKLLVHMVVAFFSGMALGMFNIGLCAIVIRFARKRGIRKRDRLLDEVPCWSLESSIHHRRLLNEDIT